MATRNQLRRAADVLLEGEAAPVAKALKPKAARTAERAGTWLGDPNIQGIGVASRERDNQSERQLALKVYVARKLPRKACEHPVPAKLRIPGLEDRVETDVEEIGAIRPQSNTSKVRPVIPGFSAAHTAAPFGTLGCFVRKVGDPDTVYLLSNSHVIANYGLASKGDVIVQPGPSDQPGPGSFTIARLDDDVKFIYGGTGFPNRVDAAIARVNPGTRADPRIRLIGAPLGISRFLKEGMVVQKTGRTTDYTRGVVKDIDFRLALEYRRTKTRKDRVGFGSQVLCTRFTDDGDSGSAILNMKQRIVGLHFAGSQSVSVFNRIGFVVDTLGIDVMTEPAS